MSGRVANVELAIEIDSEPIAGAFSVGAGAPQQFHGWIELVAAIESVRHAAPGGAEESLGAFPGVKRAAM